MAENYSQVPPNSTGEKIRLFENTVGLNDVNSEATTITDQTGQVMKNMGANGRIFVDASEVAVPITDNGGSITVDGVFFQATQPVSGTVTANAGTGPWPVTDNGGSLTVDGTVTATLPANSGVDIGDVTVNNAAGAAAVNIQDGGNSITVDGTFFQATQPVSGTFFQATQPVSGTVTATLPANSGVDIGDVTVNNAAGASAVNIQDGGNSITVDGSVTAIAQPGVDIGDVTVNNAAGAAAVNIQDGGNSITVDGTVAATQSGTWTVQPGNTANTTPWLVTPTPATSGGYLISKLISAATTNATNVKASAGQLYGYFIYNDANQTRYVKLHNTAGAPTAGAGVVMTIGIPAGSAANVEFANGIQFTTGIAFTTVTGIAEANTTAVGANELAINLFYK